MTHATPETETEPEPDPVLVVDVSDGTGGGELAARPDHEPTETPTPIETPTAGPALLDTPTAVRPVVAGQSRRRPRPEPEPEVELDLDALPGGARGALEAVLMVVEEPADESTLAGALGLPRDTVAALLTDLVAEYDAANRGFELRRVAGGWRVFSRPHFAPVVERFVLDGQTAKLTQAALETLAIVAYRQPVSRARVGAVRGVNVDAVMRTLLSRGLVTEAGNDPETGAVLYRTTDYFLHRIGLSSIEQLPALAPYLPEMDVLDELTAGGVA